MILIFLVLLVPLLPQIASYNDVEIHRLRTPLLPLEIGKTRIIETKHTFLHYIETSSLTRQLENIQYFYDKLEFTLNATKFSNSSKNIHSIIINDSFSRAKYSLITTKHKLVNLVPINKEKRGLINPIGTISKWLFGTLDSNDEQKYDRQIKTLQENQNKLAHELELQISLSQHIIENYNTTINRILENQLKLKNKIDELTKIIDNDIQNVYFYISFNSALDHIILNCQALTNFLDNLENAIMFGHLGTLHNSVISLKELLKIRSHLVSLYGNEKVLEFENPFYYYQLAGVQVRIEKKKIIFAIHIPILIENTFQTFHLIGLPMKSSIILPIKTFLVLGTDYHQFEEDPCPQLNSIYLCKKRQETTVDKCIIPLMKAEIPQCEIHEVHLTRPIVQEINNGLLLILPAIHPLKMQTSCEKKTLVRINENSLVKIPKGCNITIENSTFTADEEILLGSPLILPQFEGFDIINVSHNKPLKLQSIDADSMKQLKLEARSIELAHTDGTHPIIWNIPSIILGLLAVTCVIALISWIKKTTPRSSSNPENKPQSVLFSLKEGGITLGE